MAPAVVSMSGADTSRATVADGVGPDDGLGHSVLRRGVG